MQGSLQGGGGGQAPAAAAGVDLKYFSCAHAVSLFVLYMYVSALGTFPGGPGRIIITKREQTRTTGSSLHRLLVSLLFLLRLHPVACAGHRLRRLPCLSFRFSVFALDPAFPQS